MTLENEMTLLPACSPARSPPLPSRSTLAIVAPRPARSRRKAGRPKEGDHMATVDPADPIDANPDVNPGELWSIGHSNHPIERFLALLRQHAIATLADVRTAPYSRYSPQFNRDELAHIQADAFITAYHHRFC